MLPDIPARFVQIAASDPTFPFRFVIADGVSHDLTIDAVGWCQQEFGDEEVHLGVPAPPRWRFARDMSIMFVSQVEATAFKVRWG